ncbi:MAG: hypothetical protein CMP48_04045 [Rickettsiales bacterium]|nr:hypothetical protein [Rickettsiales bacterium]
MGDGIRLHIAGDLLTYRLSGRVTIEHVEEDIKAFKVLCLSSDRKFNLLLDLRRSEFDGLPTHKKWSEFVHGPYLKRHVQKTAIVNDESESFNQEREWFESDQLKFFTHGTLALNWL